MRLWLDDVRPMPEDFDRHCRTAEEARAALATGQVSFISFDHDLGDSSPKEETGYTVAQSISLMAYFGTLPKLAWAIHSANPVGAENIRFAMRNAEKYWSRDGK